MSNNVPTSPSDAPILEADHYSPFAKRSVWAIFLFVIGLILVGAFILWYAGFFGSQEKMAQTESESGGAVFESYDSRYPAESGKDSVYSFFRSLFSGASSGVANSPINLPESLKERSLEAMTTLEDNAQAIASIDDGYSYSLYDVVGSDVVDIKGRRAGNVHDIIVDKETGEAGAVIVDEKGQSYRRELAFLSYQKVQKQEASGRVTLTVTDNKFEDNKEFRYTKLNEEGYVSLRNLRDGQVLDDQGKVAGQIEAVIYENAEAQTIVLKLKPSLTPKNKGREFSLNFEDANIIQNPDGYDIKLTAEQTEDLAKTLYE